MMSTKTLKYIRQTINHPYVGLRILPIIGDFTGHAMNVTKSLYNEDVINQDEFEHMKNLINDIERNETDASIKELISIFKVHAEWS